jgi:ribosomal protein S18 acetylase RimI-like enzyme
MYKGLAIQRGELWVKDIGRAEEVFPIPARLPVTFIEIKPSLPGSLVEALGPESQSEILRRLQSGRRCFAGCLDQSVVCWGWVSRGEEQIGEMKAQFRMKPSEAYIWDCVTLPDYRRQGLYSSLLGHMLKELQREAWSKSGYGANRVWIGSNLENRPSIRGFERAGFQPVIRVLFLNIFGIRFFQISACPKARGELVGAGCNAFSTGRALRIEPQVCASVAF